MDQGLLLIGVGEANTVDLTVTWPNGTKKSWTNLSTDTSHHLTFD